MTGRNKLEAPDFFFFLLLFAAVGLFIYAVVNFLVQR